MSERDAADRMASKRTIRLTIELTYNPDRMHGDDPDAMDWFELEILRGPGGLLLHSNEIGDAIGSVRVVDEEADAAQRERERIVAWLRKQAERVTNYTGVPLHRAVRLNDADAIEAGAGGLDERDEEATDE